MEGMPSNSVLLLVAGTGLLVIIGGLFLAAAIAGLDLSQIFQLGAAARRQQPRRGQRHELLGDGDRLAAPEDDADADIARLPPRQQRRRKIELRRLRRTAAATTASSSSSSVRLIALSRMVHDCFD